MDLILKVVTRNMSCLKSLLFFSFCLSLLFYVNEVRGNSALALVKIKDNNLAACIKKNAEKKQWQSASDITEIKCHGMNITSLVGLESFDSLKKLSLFNNQLTSVDLQTFKHLEHINIANNRLTNINIVGLAQLKSLYLFKNKLITVDFNGVSQLKKIRITNNKLKILDISPLISLEKAYFFDNKLEELIVAGLPKLKFIELRQNPMPDEVYDRYDALEGITIIHDGNADDWK